MAGPWLPGPSLNENGFYWLAIVNDPPQPHNNVRIHHHRKVVIDSDNNTYPDETGNHAWSKIWTGKEYVMSGEHPVMAFALDGVSPTVKGRQYDRVGQPFISIADSKWNWEARDGEIHAVDAYKDNTWYHACIWRRAGRFGGV